MILVVGSTGILGGLVVRKLATTGRSVAAFVRDLSSERAMALKAAGAQTVGGDLKDRASVESALRGIHAVVCTATSTLSRAEGDSIDAVDAAGVQGLIELAAVKAIRRFVFVSISPNMGEDFPLAFAKRMAERRLRESRLDYVVLQPSYFSEVWFSPTVGFDVAGGRVRIYGDGKARVSYISVDDVTRAAIAALEIAEIGRETIPIGGVQAISQLDALEIAARASGKRLLVDHMPLDQIRAQRSGAADPMQASFFALLEHLALGDVIPAGWTEHLAVHPAPSEQWLERTYGGNAQAE